MTLWKQLWLLVKKNILLRRRQPVTIVVEFVWPIIILLIVAAIKQTSPPSIKGPCYYEPLELPNGDFLSFMKSFVCMLDHKCHETSRLKEAIPANNSIAPLYEIVVSNDNSYEKVALLLENLKNALYDVDDLRNEPIVLKIQNGSISINDFLNDTREFKKVLFKYGLSDEISESFLNSKIKIIEIYKFLNFSSSIKEKNLCDPLKAMSYIKASAYFYQDPIYFDKESAQIFKNFSKEENSNYNLADLICKLPKRKLINDADLLSKQINVSFISNYSDSIINFFTSSKFNETIYYLTRYFTSGQTFGQDLSLFSKFSDFDQIKTTIQSGLRLIDFIEKYNEQILFAKKITEDFAPVFDTINEFKQLEIILDFTIAVNKLLSKMNRLFTIRSMFGTGVIDFFQMRLDSNAYISSYELQRANINFQKSIQFILKLQTNSYEAVCYSPKITSLLASDFPKDIQSNLEYNLDKYCAGMNYAPVKQTADTILSQFDFLKLFNDVKYQLPDKELDEFLKLSSKIATLNFNQIRPVDAEGLMYAFSTLNAAFEFVEDFLRDTSKLNLKNFYYLAKRLIQTFAPDFLTIREWLYIDTLVPVLLPTIQTSTIVQALQNGRLNSEIYNISKRSVENGLDLFSLIGHFMNANGPGPSLKDSGDLNLRQGIPSGISSGSSSFSILELINSPGSAASLAPLLSFLPIEKLFPGLDKQVVIGVLSSTPQITDIIQTFINFKIPITSTTNPETVLYEWSAFVGQIREQTLNIIQILTNVKLLKPVDSKIIQSVLSANIETIANPDVVGKLVLACHGVNVWGAVQPDLKEMRNSISSISLIMDITFLAVNTTLQLVQDDGVVFKCTNDPFMDYYSLTKKLNLLDTAAKIKQLILNQQTANSLGPNPKLNCMQIDSIYSKSLRLEQELKKDTSGIIVNKLNCFKTSIFLPYETILKNFQVIFDVASSNTDTITILSTQMNKIADLAKVLNWVSEFFQTDSSSSIGSLTLLVSLNHFESPDLLADLIEIFPSMLEDLKAMGSSLINLQKLQDGLDLNSIQGSNNMLSVLDSLKFYEDDIEEANKALTTFWRKYFDIITKSSYSSLLFDIQKGIESLSNLVQFFNKNFNGVKVNKVFSDYKIVEDYLQNNYGLSKGQTQAIGQSFLYYDPQVCSLANNLGPVVYENVLIPNPNRIPKFWESSSKFLCTADRNSLTEVGSTFAKYFTLPDNVREIFENDASILQKLTKNSTIFDNLNITTSQVLNSNSMAKLNDLFDIFSEFSTGASVTDLPDLFGKALCGPKFSLRLEDFGYSIRPVTFEVPVQDTLSEESLKNSLNRIYKSKRRLENEHQFKSLYCKNLYDEMRSVGGYIIGNLITPLIFGKILYTPKTNLTYQIIQKFNETFLQFDQLNRVLKSFADGLNQFDDLKKLTANLSILLDNPFYQDFIQLFLLQDSTLTLSDIKMFLVTLENVTSMNDDWTYTSSLVSSLKDAFSCFEIDRFVAFENEADLEKEALTFFNNGTLLMGLVFENIKPSDNEIPPNFSVKIRTNADNVPETYILRPWLWVPGPADNLYMDLRYMRGFIQIQNLVERSILKFIMEKKQKKINMMNKKLPLIYLNQFPHPKYKKEDNTASYVNYFILPIIITLTWSGNIGLAIRNLVRDKEKFVEETMRAMGLRPGINWLAWFLTTYLTSMIVSVFLTLILKYGGIYPASNFALIYLALVSFSFTAIMLSFFVGSFFNKTNLASLIGILSYFISYLPFILVMSLKYEITFGVKFLLCLFAATGFGYSSLYLSWYEQQGKGLQFEDVWKSPITNDSMNYGYSIMILILDGIVYGLLGWYVKKVFPGRYGASQPWYFIVSPKYWSRSILCKFCIEKKIVNSEIFNKDGSIKDNSKYKYIENEPTKIPVGISIKKLTRKFKEKVVVNNLSLNFFEGQITSLLGHNGAGKSTTINILTGIYVPTSGTALINGHDVRHEYDSIRKNIGICPQHDTLFEFMTVKEHLEFYGILKGNLGGKELKEEIEDMIVRMGLTNYTNAYASTLSGGLRRRLEVGIAFVSGSKTVILDEPTSGVDPYNRMKIWDIILEFRSGRTIVLTTHYLEEADVLSDRIAIIHQGKLQCCGSSLFLKNKFGRGYILTVDKTSLTPSLNSKGSKKQMMMESKALTTERICEFIQKRISGAVLSRQLNNTLNFTLPYSQKSNFKHFFNSLDRNKKSLEISGYGISDTTLEEIFLLLTTRDENGDLNSSLNSTNRLTDSVKNGSDTKLSTTIESDLDSGCAIEMGSLDNTLDKTVPKIMNPNATLNSSMETISYFTNMGVPTRYTKIDGKKLYLQQFATLLLKRFHHYRRNLKVFFTNIILPCVFVAISMAFTTIKPTQVFQPKILISPEIYRPNDVFFAFGPSKDVYLDQIYNDYRQLSKSVCRKEKSRYYSNEILLRQSINSNLCNLVPSDNCSLIYEHQYNKQLDEKIIQNSLKLSQKSSNCSVEPYLIETFNENINIRFGGITFGDDFILDSLYENNSKIMIWFQNQAFHSMTSFLHEFYSIYAQCVLNSANGSCKLFNSVEERKPLYRIYNHPLNLNDIRISYETIIQKVADIGISLTILCAYSFIPAGFIVYIVRERITQEKRLQFVCGVKPFLYWFSSFVWDFSYYLIIIALTLAIIGGYNSTAYSSNARNFGALVLLLILFGWSSLPMSYLMSRFFSDTGSAYMIGFCFTLFSGIATCVAVFLLSFLAETNQSIAITYKILDKMSLLFPSFSLGSGLIELTKNQILSEAYSIIGQNNVYKDPFSFDMLGIKFLALFLTGTLFFIIIAIMESDINFFPFCKPGIESFAPAIQEDIDVGQERKRIQNDEANYDVLLAKNLTKKYRKATGSRVCAVNNVCFSIPLGHCFGLLGINGAGKTTTFKMITGEIKPTFGTCMFNNKTMDQFLKDNIIGYCPQFDAVDEYLTGKEALYIYSRLIGIKEIQQAIHSAITRFKLQSFIDTPIIKYSGGMRRSLSVAVSMLGDPQVVLLDEPTNAMDPEMRRRVWDNILNLIKEDRSVLLTSHSMAECDVLCSRLAIMVSGQFVCLGTTQHLKHRFGGGYTLQIKTDKDSELNNIMEFVQSKFLNCILKDKHGNKLEYIIPHKGNSLGKIFGVMESNKVFLGVGDYSVSQTTLDQVFINFAKSTSDSESDLEEEENTEEDLNESYSTFYDEKDGKNQVIEIKANLTEEAPNLENNAVETMLNDTPNFESIKQHFNSLKKSRHIRKTSSAKSQDFKQSQQTRKSIKSVRSKSSTRQRKLSRYDDDTGEEGGFTNLAYEVEFKNSDQYEIQTDEQSHDINSTIEEEGEYFSKC
uniref:ATP-binding cassette transporter subfamily A member 1-like protein X3 n=1 Tax=Brachionus plicatilis TaxID=10195 RepID=A0A7H9SMX4_BRAPC|nr:ATP-binding cassette transporter subfamily A member 1-like protein X3 [Brachionus plicatilis]